jgi:hypothetical protein
VTIVSVFGNLAVMRRVTSLVTSLVNEGFTPLFSCKSLQATRLIASAVACGLLALAGCSEEDSSGENTNTNGTESTTPTDTNTDDTTSDDQGTTETTPSNTDNTETTTDTSPKENGELCDTDEDCISNACHAPIVGSMGTCSECKDDAACQNSAAGKACVLSLDMGDAAFWVCGAGILGDSCEADTSCSDGLTCAKISTPLADLNVCSECADNSGCAAGTEVCNVTGDFTARKVYNSCEPVDSLAADAVCTPPADGQADACQGFCVGANLGIGGVSDSIGVCGACRPDHAEEDCGAGIACSEATISLTDGTATGSKCG